MTIDRTKNLTPYQDINDILAMFSENLKNIFRDQLIGVYLTGSLTYGGFDRGNSDIDLLVVLRNAFSKEQREQVKNIHASIEEDYPFWTNRIECSYITEGMLQSEEPPSTPRPYINGGQMWDPDPPYGNEWLLNLYVLYDCGVALVGADPKTLIGHPISIDAVRKASKKDLHQEWEPLLKNSSALEDSHFQVYVVLTLCRILHRAKNDNIVSKKISSAWVKKNYGESWCYLIEEAEDWQYGQERASINETLQFLQFTLQELR